MQKYAVVSQSEYRKHSKTLTNRQLLKAYREQVKHGMELAQAQAQNWLTYLGDPLILVRADHGNALWAMTQEVRERGYQLSKIKI